MTKQSKSGKVKKHRAHDTRNLDDLIVGEGEVIEVGAKDAPQENIKWEAKEGEVHSDPINDPGRGQTVVIRTFSFKLPEGLKEKPTNDELLDYHTKYTLIPMLWKDELELKGEPRIMSGKEKDTFVISAACAPRFVAGVRSYVNEKAALVQDIINDSPTDTD